MKTTVNNIKPVNKINYDLYSNYIQKSRLFCYTVTGIKKGSVFMPHECYMALDGFYDMNDYRLIVYYKECNKSGFNAYATNELMKKPLFEKVIRLNDKQSLFVFNFESHQSDWNKILNGKYSQLSPSYKHKIEQYYLSCPENKRLIYKILNPKFYFDGFASLIDIDPKIIEEVGEVLDKPHPVFEKLTLTVIENNLSSTNN
jgi:hypothetical protein